MPAPASLYDATRRSVADMLDTDMRRNGAGHTDVLVEGALVALREHLVARHGVRRAYDILARHADLAAAPIPPHPQYGDL